MQTVELFAALALVIFASGHASADTHKRALYARTAKGFEVVMSREVRNMAHDPSGLFQRSRIEECHLVVDKMSGTFDVEDIQVFEIMKDHQGHTWGGDRPYKVQGTVTFDRGMLTTDLRESRYTDDPSNHKDPYRGYSFNGVYRLVKAR